MQDIRCCGSCRFFMAATEECRHSPPIRLPRRFSPDATAESRTRDEQLLFGWPRVQSHDWCGAYAYEMDKPQ